MNKIHYNFKDVLLDVLKKLGIKVEVQFRSMTSDNASNNCSLAEKLDIPRFPCVFHVDHLLESLIALVMMAKKSEGEVKEYSNLDFFKNYKHFSDAIFRIWHTLEVLFLSLEEDEKAFEKNNEDTTKIIKKISVKKLKKPTFGEDHRFHSFGEYSFWVSEKLEMLQKSIPLLEKSQYINKADSILFSKFLNNNEKIAVLVDIFSFCQELLDLCYYCDGFCIEEFFPTLDKFLAKLDEKSDSWNNFPNLKAIVKKENEEKWLGKMKIMKQKVKALFLKHYQPVIDSKFFQWAKLGNAQTLKQICEKKLKENDNYRNWIIRFPQFFSNPTKLQDVPELFKEWCGDFASINVTELLAESDVKTLKSHVFYHENDDTVCFFHIQKLNYH